MSEEVVELVCRCISCREINHYESMLCKECGIVIIRQEFLCSGCEKLVELVDEKCYSCGKQIEKTEAPEIEIGKMNKEEKEEKEKFIEELKKKIYGIEFNFFEKEITSSLDYYPTVKLLFSEECPEELSEYYGIKNKKETDKKLEKIAMNFINTLGGIITGERYANIVLSTLALFWIEKQYYKLSEYKGLLILLKSESRFYEQLLEFGEDRETITYFYKKVIISTTFQDMIFSNQIDRGRVRS